MKQTYATTRSGAHPSAQCARVESVTRQAASILTNRGGKLDWSTVASDSFGNAIGNTTASDIRYNRQRAATPLTDAWAAQMRAKYLSPEALSRSVLVNWNAYGGNDASEDGYRHFSADPVTGELVDQNGNPAPVLEASSLDAMNRTIPRTTLPDIEPAGQSLYVGPLPLWRTMERIDREAANPQNSETAKIGYSLAGTFLGLPALAEEFLLRPVLNIPYGVVSGGSEWGQYLARGNLQSDSSAALLDYGRAVGAFSKGFTSAATVAVPVTGTLEGSIANTTSREALFTNLQESALSRNSSRIETFFARSSQIESGYSADQWTNTFLRQGDVVYTLSPGKSPFFTDLSTVRATRLDSFSLTEALQVRPHEIYGYRPDLSGFRVTQDLFVPSARATANPQFGPGGANQLFLRNYEDYLEPISTIHLRKP